MDCPVCRDAMIVLELDNVEIDYCPACCGIWLDKGELELLLGSSSKKDELLSAFRVDSQNKEKKRPCPICLKKMQKVFCADEGNILIEKTPPLEVSGRPILVDKCAKGDGIWFDRGELNGIIQRSSLGKDSRVLNLVKDMFAGEFNVKKDGLN